MPISTQRSVRLGEYIANNKASSNRKGQRIIQPYHPEVIQVTYSGGAQGCIIVVKLY